MPFENWVLVKVNVFLLCTENKNWKTGQPYPGHEAAGEVVAVAKPCKVEVFQTQQLKLRQQVQKWHKR